MCMSLLQTLNCSNYLNLLSSLIFLLSLPVEPQTPVNGREVDATETTITIAWEPANPACSFQYEVSVYNSTLHPSLPLTKPTATYLPSLSLLLHLPLVLFILPSRV